MGTRFQRNDSWDRLRGQALVKIGRWYSRQPLTNHKKRLSIQTIPEIAAPKACAHSSYSFWRGELESFHASQIWDEVKFIDPRPSHWHSPRIKGLYT